MTDAEVDSLAHEILDEAISEVQKLAPLHCQVVVSQTGESCLEFVGTSKEGHGSFWCRYHPFQPIKKLIVESGHLFDKFEITLTDKQTGNISTEALREYAPEFRSNAIRMMSRCAALFLVGSFYPRMSELFQDNFAENHLTANGVLAEWAVSFIESDESIHGKTDMQNEIKQAVERVSARTRARLLAQFSALPNIVAERGKGAPTKSESERTRERAEYSARIVDTYRALRDKAGKKPAKVRVAEALGEGGRNKSGSDTRLGTFNLKLKRLKINYDELVQKVEDEGTQ